MQKSHRMYLYTLIIIVLGGVSMLFFTHKNTNKPCNDKYGTYLGSLGNESFSFQYPCSWISYPDSEEDKMRGLRIEGPNKKSGLIFPSYGGGIWGGYELIEFETEIDGKRVFGRTFDYSNKAIVYIRFAPENYNLQLVYFYEKDSGDKETLENVLATMKVNLPK